MAPFEKAACPICGWKTDDIYDVQYVKPGTVVGGRYLLGEYAHKNGEGALYAGFDNTAGQRVWVREYFPRTMAQRDMKTGRVSPLSGCGAGYKALMSDFVDVCNEIKRLSVTEQVVPLENVISENNTVYAIYKGLDIVSFEEYLEGQGGSLSYHHAFSLLAPIVNSLEVLHSHGHIHRGISPYTIYMAGDGKLYLWDFALGATRTSGSELDSELFTGYSAPEQYSPNGWQGSWTDVYAIGALFYRTLTGVVPPKSIRIDKEQNQLTHLSELLPDLNRNAAAAVWEAMNPIAEDRLQAVQTFLSRMVEQKSSSSTAVFDRGKVQRDSGEPRKKPAPRHGQTSEEGQSERPPRRRREGGGTFKYMVLGTLVMLVVLVGIIYYFVTTTLGDIIGMPAVSQPYQTEEPASPPGAVAHQLEAVPNFVGSRLTDFVDDPDYLERFVFTVRQESRPEWPGGTVFEQIPAPGQMMPVTERINIALWVSRSDIEMPTLIGELLEDAIQVLAELEVANFHVLERLNTEVPPGTILETIPAAGESFNPDRGSVALVVAIQPAVTEGNQQQQQDEGINEDEWDLAEWAHLRPEDIFDPETGEYRIPIFRNR